MRPIDADALKDKLQQHHDFWVMAWGGFSKMPISDKKRVDEITNCIAEVVNAPTIDAVSEWIPCSERMPDANGKYLCCWQGKSVETGMFLNGHFRLYGEIKDRLVTAWMPLPKPYEEVKENE